MKDKNRCNTGGTMKRIHIVAFLTTCLIFSFLLSGCGEGPGPPGTEGAEDVGVDIRISSISHSDPNTNYGDIWTIDIVQDLCPNGEPETFGEDFMNIGFIGIALYDRTLDTVLYITNYKVTFYQLNPTSPPIDEIHSGYQGLARISTTMETGPFPFLVFDVGMKARIVDDITNGPFFPASLPMLYEMTVEMWGQDMYGQDFKVPVIIRQIILNNYDNC
jgi:hypothetical protein